MAQPPSGGCCDVSRINTQKIEHLLQSGKLESCRETVELFLQEINFRSLESLMLRLYVTMDIYIAARSFSREIGIENELFVARFGSIDEISGKMQTVDGTTQFLHEMLEQCIHWRIEAASGGGNEIITRAKEYIDRNYMNEDLSLRIVADTVGLSPSYLSAVFKREMKQNFSEYLTEVRIRHAKELLCCTSKLIYEVAYAVGFRDYRYFGQIFKKQTGQTPRQFQSSTNVC
ncbi:MAG: helix-turn-helix domain-containing protein [Oscillospiraceae bacterium]|nr:helix-turn-helix domain-containing protein [Oscillospiraceae bacterium]